MTEINFLQEAKQLKERMKGLSDTQYMHEQVKPVVDKLNYLIEDDRVYNSRIHIMDYIENFLPLHLGFAREDDNFNIEDWIDFVGTPYKEAYVVDSNNNIIATVPSIYPENNIALLNEEATDIEEADYTLGEKMNIVRLNAEKFKEAAARQRAEVYGQILNRFSEKAIETHREKWRKFFEQIGITRENTERYAKDLGVKLDVPKPSGDKQAQGSGEEAETVDNPFIFV